MDINPPRRTDPIEPWEIRRLLPVVRRAIEILYPEWNPASKLIGVRCQGLPRLVMDFFQVTRYRDHLIRQEKIRRVNPRKDVPKRTLEHEIQELSDSIIKANRLVAGAEIRLIRSAETRFRS